MSEQQKSVKEAIDLMDVVAQYQKQSKRKSPEVNEDSNLEQTQQPSKKKQKKIDAKTKVIQQAEEKPTKKNDKKENGKKEQEQQVEVGVKVDNVQEPSTQAPEQTANHDNSTKKKKKQKKKKRQDN